jgi:hypothetical protein
MLDVLSGSALYSQILKISCDVLRSLCFRMQKQPEHSGSVARKTCKQQLNRPHHDRLTSSSQCPYFGTST